MGGQVLRWRRTSSPKAVLVVVEGPITEQFTRPLTSEQQKVLLLAQVERRESQVRLVRSVATAGSGETRPLARPSECQPSAEVVDVVERCLPKLGLEGVGVGLVERVV